MKVHLSFFSSVVTDQSIFNIREAFNDKYLTVQVRLLVSLQAFVVLSTKYGKKLRLNFSIKSQCSSQIFLSYQLQIPENGCHQSQVGTLRQIKYYFKMSLQGVCKVFHTKSTKNMILSFPHFSSV